MSQQAAAASITQEELWRRLDVVEHTIATSGWSGRIERGLAKSLGVQPRTVRKYRRQVEKRLAKGLRLEDRERATAAFLERLRAAEEQMVRDGKWGPFVASMGLRMRVMGLEAPTKVEHEHRHEAAPARVASLLNRLPAHRVLELREGRQSLAIAAPVVDGEVVEDAG